jgi:hypothetical protein
MANIRFLDQVAVTAFENTPGNSSSTGAVIPAVILPGQTYTISPNTSVATYRLTNLGTLRIEKGSEVEAPDGQILNTNGQLWIDDVLENQGTIINDGLLVIGTE